MRKEPTEEQKAQAKARREKFRSFVKTLAKMSDEERKALAEKIPIATVDGHILSVHNHCLLILQRPDITVVGGFRQWKKQGRFVRKGEHGLMIWVPIVYGDGKKGEEIPQPAELDGKEEKAGVRFVMGTVFDLSQTEERGTDAVAA